MQLDEYQEKLKLSYENSFISENIHELVELFSELANIKNLSYYKYEYEYNDFFHKFNVLKLNNLSDDYFTICHFLKQAVFLRALQCRQ